MLDKSSYLICDNIMCYYVHYVRYALTTLIKLWILDYIPDFDFPAT